MSGCAEAPARFEDLPSVLDAEQLEAVLRCNRRKVYELVNTGRLGRLSYSRTLLVDAREVRRFLREQTTWAASVDGGDS